AAENLCGVHVRPRAKSLGGRDNQDGSNRKDSAGAAYRGARRNEFPRFRAPEVSSRDRERCSAVRRVVLKLHSAAVLPVPPAPVVGLAGDEFSSWREWQNRSKFGQDEPASRG